jgi:hypothetical protein
VTKLVPYVEQRLRRPMPDGVPVVPGSTPVLAFGDPTTATIATLGLNPSRVEFLDESGAILGPEQRRLVDLPQLGLPDLHDATDEQLQAVVDGCDGYFERKPYWRWFRPLDALLHSGFGVTYTDGSACHLDLSQWATDPVWSGLSGRHRRVLIEQDAPFLAEQLQQENVQVLLLCGRAVLTAMTGAGLVKLEKVAQVTNAARTLSCDVLGGTAGSAAAYGWSSNLQSQPGVDNHLKQRLAEALADLINNEGGQPVATGIDEGTEVSSKAELADLLRTWHRTTNEPTLGDLAQYGGRPYVHIVLGDVHVVLNADTKRAAVERYLVAVEAHGADLPWQVVQGRTRVNKVVYEGMDTSAGWYAYTTRELEAPQWL